MFGMEKLFAKDDINCDRCHEKIYGFGIKFGQVDPPFWICEPCLSELILGTRRPYRAEIITK